MASIDRGFKRGEASLPSGPPLMAFFESRYARLAAALRMGDVKILTTMAEHIDLIDLVPSMLRYCFDNRLQTSTQWCVEMFKINIAILQKCIQCYPWIESPDVLIDVFIGGFETVSIDVEAPKIICNGTADKLTMQWPWHKDKSTESIGEYLANASFAFILYAPVSVIDDETREQLAIVFISWILKQNCTTISMITKTLKWLLKHGPFHGVPDMYIGGFTCMDGVMTRMKNNTSANLHPAVV